MDPPGVTETDGICSSDALPRSAITADIVKERPWEVT